MNPYRIGSIGYATEQGLGILLKSFHDANVITDVVIIGHGSRQTHMEWYKPGTQFIGNLRDTKQIEQIRHFCSQMDVMLFFETPFLWELIPYCRSKGIKTVMMPMYECMPKQWPYQPDAIINPSLLDQQFYFTGTFIPVPVDGITWKPRTIATTFVHNAGHGGLLGRNGTKELLDAWIYVKSPAQLIIRSQDPLFNRPQLVPDSLSQDRRLDYRIGTTSSRDQLYAEGDVFIFPEKFNGLSLPLQEATASGMAVMTTNRFPNTEHLPDFIPINVSGYKRNRISSRTVEFAEAILDPKIIAAKIDEVYGTDITKYSLSGKQWSSGMSWDVLRPRYMAFLTRLVEVR